MTPPPSPEQPVTDAEALALRYEVNAHIQEVEEDKLSTIILRLLADRARDKEHIGELERRMRHIRSWTVDAVCALLGEVPDAK